MLPECTAVRRGFTVWTRPTDATLPQIVPDDALDHAIRPLVTALNRTGWARTVFSCAGHPEEPDAVQTGRRQAHVDVAILRPQAWSVWVRAVRREAPRAVAQVLADADVFDRRVMDRGVMDRGVMDRRVMDRGVTHQGTAGRGSVRLRVAEGDLGALPEWLDVALTDHTPVAFNREPGPWTRSLARFAQRVGLPWIPAAPTPWHYRRLVLEPVPYSIDGSICRTILDTAISAATSCLNGEGSVSP